MGILIAGAGALGLYYGGRLSAAGEDVRFLARGDNLEALRDRLRIDSIDGDLILGPQRASNRMDEIIDGVDLVVVTVKAFATDEIVKELAWCGYSGTVLSLQNGVANEERICAGLPDAEVLGGIAFIGSERVAPARVRHTAAGHVIVGPFANTDTSEAERWCERFRAAGVRANVAADIRYELWRKLLWNIGFNTTTALTGTLASELLETTEGEKLVRGLMEEAIQVAAAEGIEIEPAEIDRYLEVTRNMGPVRTSMLVDRENGRHIEWEAICGDIVRRGERSGVSTPRARVIAALLEVLDRSLGR